MIILGMNVVTKPVISVCIPTYNRAELLNKALRSILEDFDGINVEVIVSDNASEDNTEEVVRAYQSDYPSLKYYRNEKNIGLDDNAVASIQRAEGEYVFLFSDDDVFLPGSAKYLLDLIDKFKPSFLYLNIRGFWETENPDIVLRRKTPADTGDRIYRDGFGMVLDFFPSHFSAMIFRRADAIRQLHDLEDDEPTGYTRGYAAVRLANHVALASPPPVIFVGKCCVAVRNLRRPDYNIIHANSIDIPRHCQNLRKKNLLNERQYQKVIYKWALRPLPRLIVRMKGAFDSRFTRQEADIIWQTYKAFPLSYLTVLPLLLLPRFTLVAPLYTAFGIRWLYHKITGRSVFE